ENDSLNLTLNYTTNGSVDTEEFNNYNCSSFTHALIILECVCLGVSVCGLVGNGVVMWFLGFQMKQNPFTVYILNLAIADFSLSLLFFLILVPFLVFATLCTLSHLFSVYYEFEIVLGFLCHLFNISSLGLLTALSVERCVSIL
ncbi:MRGRD protein, partial [Serilophus lunatus]|nr:MRGRD protein [Serilophus lunatus]